MSEVAVGPSPLELAIIVVILTAPVCIAVSLVVSRGLSRAWSRQLDGRVRASSLDGARLGAGYPIVVLGSFGTLAVTPIASVVALRTLAIASLLVGAIVVGSGFAHRSLPADRSVRQWTTAVAIFGLSVTAGFVATLSMVALGG